MLTGMEALRRPWAALAWLAVCGVCGLVGCSNEAEPDGAAEEGGAGTAAGAGAAAPGGGSGGRAAGGAGAAATAGSSGAAGTSPNVIGGPAGQGGAGGQSQSQGGKGGQASPAAGSGGAGGAGPAAGSGGTSAASPQTVYVSGYGPNIHILTLDTQTGQLTPRQKQSGGTAPSYMAFSPDKRFTYVINEANGQSSKALAFKVNADGTLTMLNSAVTGGSGSPHLAVHPSGKWLVVAHYASGQVTVIPIKQDGSLGSAGEPDRGPDDDCENAHQAEFDVSGDHLFVPCLGTNYVIQYVWNAGALGYNDPPTVAVSGGPRHMAFDPQQKHAYVLSETASTIKSFE